MADDTPPQMVRNEAREGMRGVVGRCDGMADIQDLKFDFRVFHTATERHTIIDKTPVSIGRNAVFVIPQRQLMQFAKV